MIYPTSEIYGWFTSAGVGSNQGTYSEIDETLEIEAKQIWQFKYSQTAFASTTMKNISITISWIQDIQYTNYQYTI